MSELLQKVEQQFDEVETPDGGVLEIPRGDDPQKHLNAWTAQQKQSANKYPWSPQALKEKFVAPPPAPTLSEQVLTPAQERAKKTIGVNAEPQSTGAGALLEKAAVGVDQGLDALGNVYSKGVVPENRRQPLIMGGPLAELAEAETRRRTLARESALAQEYWPQEKVRAEWLKARQTPVPGSPEWSAIKREASDKALGALSTVFGPLTDVIPGTATELYKQAQDPNARIDLPAALGFATAAWYDRTKQLLQGDFADPSVPVPPLPYDDYYKTVTGEDPGPEVSLFGNIFFDASMLLDPAVASKVGKWIMDYGPRKAFEQAIKAAELAAVPANKVRKTADTVLKLEEQFKQKVQAATGGAAERFAPRPLTAEQETARLEASFKAEQTAANNAALEQQARVAELNGDFELAASLRGDKVRPPAPTRTGENARPIVEPSARQESPFLREQPLSPAQQFNEEDLAIRRQIVQDNPSLLTPSEAANLANGGEPPARRELIAREQRIVDSEMARRQSAKQANAIPRQRDDFVETVGGENRPQPIIAPETNRAALAEEMREDDLLGRNGPDRKTSATAKALDSGDHIPEKPMDATRDLFTQRDRFQGGRRPGLVSAATLPALGAAAAAPMGIEHDERGNVTGINSMAIAAMGVPIVTALIVGRKAASRVNIGLQQAEALIKAGASPAEVKKLTGWVNEAGILKREISDKGAVVKPVPAVGAYSDPPREYFAGGKSFRLPANKSADTTLGEVLDHKVAYAMYPDFAAVPVTLIDKTIWDNLKKKLGMPSEVKGFTHMPAGGTVADSHLFMPATLSQKEFRVLYKGTPLHEFEHLVQRKEGFAYRPEGKVITAMTTAEAKSAHAAAASEKEAKYVAEKYLAGLKGKPKGFISPTTAGLATGAIGAGAAQGPEDESRRNILYAIAGAAVAAIALPKFVKPLTQKLAKNLKGNPELTMLAKSIGEEPEKPGMMARLVQGFTTKISNRIGALDKLPAEGKIGVSGATLKARTQAGKTAYYLQEAVGLLADAETGVGNKTVRNNKELFALDIKAARDIDRWNNRNRQLGAAVGKLDGAKSAAYTAQSDYERALREWDASKKNLRRGMPGAAQDYERSVKETNAALKRRDAALKDVERYEKDGTSLDRPVNQRVVNPSTGAAEEITADVARTAQTQIAKILKKQGYDYSEFERARQNWKRITNQNILQVLEDAGIVSDKRAAEIRAGNDFYATYEYLDLAASEANQYGQKGAGTAGLILPVKGAPEEIFGSDLGPVIRNPVDATIAKMEQAYYAAGRNAVLQEIVKPEVARQYKGIYRIADSEDELARLQAFGTPAVSEEQARLYSRRNLAPLAVYENGQRNRYLIPTDIFEAVQNINTRHLAKQVPAIMRAASTVLRETATSLSLPFAIANVFRDAGLAYLSSPVYGMSPTNMVKFAVDWFAGFGSAVKHELGFSSRVDDYLKHGGGFGPMGWMREETDKFSQLMPSAWRKLSNVVLSPVHLVQAITETTELATRTGVFRRALKMGYTMDEAAFLARCATVDFTRGGTLTKALNMWVPFLNARVQGSLTLLEAAKRDPALFIAKLIQGTILPAAAATAWNLTTDPEGYYQIDSKLREDYFVIQTGRGKDENGRDAPTALYIPKGTQGKLWNPFQYAIDKQWEKDPRKTWGAQVVSLVEAVLPFELTDRDGKFAPTKIMAGLMPPLGIAVGQAATNRKWYFDQPIDYPWEEKIAPELRYNKRTPWLYKEAGEYLGVSPKQLQTFASALVASYSNPVEAVTATTGRFYRTEGTQNEQVAIRIVQDLEKSEATAKKRAEIMYLEGRRDWRTPMLEHNRAIKEQMAQLTRITKESPKIAAGVRKRYQISTTEMEGIVERAKKKTKGESLGYLERTFGQ